MLSRGKTRGTYSQKGFVKHDQKHSSSLASKAVYLSLFFNYLWLIPYVNIMEISLNNAIKIISQCFIAVIYKLSQRLF